MGQSNEALRGEHAMKLIYCPECGDIIGLLVNKLRFCDCKKCCGMYLKDGKHAVTNGQGIALAINTHDLIRTESWAFTMLSGKSKVPLIEAVKAGLDPQRFRLECWARPHSGQANSRTKVDPNLGKEV